MTPENGKAAEAPKAPRHRSPNYPGISLKTAAEKITGWFKKDGHVAALKDAAIKQMGGDPGRVASALKNFGLIAEENGRIKLTQRGLEIAARQPEDSKRKQAIKDAALSPTIYSELVNLYPSGLPSDMTLQSELITEKHFNQNYVSDFIKDFRETLEFAEISPSAVVESEVNSENKQEEGPEIKIGDYVQWESQGMLRLPAARRVTGFSEDGEWAFLEGSTTGVPVAELNLSDAPPPSVVPPSPPSAAALVKPPPYEPGEKLKSALRTPPPNPQYVAPANVRQDVFSLGEGPVTIQWPASLSPESFQDLSAWLDILKRKIGRSVPFKVTKRDVIVKLRAGYRIDGDPESDTPCVLIDPSQTNFDSCALVPAEMLRELLDDGIVENNTGDGRRLFKMA